MFVDLCGQFIYSRWSIIIWFDHFVISILQTAVACYGPPLNFNISFYLKTNLYSNLSSCFTGFHIGSFEMKHLMICGWEFMIYWMGTLSSNIDYLGLHALNIGYISCIGSSLPTSRIHRHFVICKIVSSFFHWLPFLPTLFSFVLNIFSIVILNTRMKM